MHALTSAWALIFKQSKKVHQVVPTAPSRKSRFAQCLTGSRDGAGRGENRTGDG